MNFIKLISFICTFLLLLAIAKMPQSYYIFLRLIVTVSGIIVIARDVKNLQPVWLVLFVIITLLFNPVVPVYFYKKSLWLPIDIVAAIVFFGYGMQHTLNKKI